MVSIVLGNLNTRFGSSGGAGDPGKYVRGQFGVGELNEAGRDSSVSCLSLELVLSTLVSVRRKFTSSPGNTLAPRTGTALITS